MQAILSQQWIAPITIFGFSLLIALGVREVCFRLLKRDFQGRIHFAHVFAETIRFPSVLWCFAGALVVAAQYAHLTPRQLAGTHKLIGAFLILSISLAVAAMTVRMISVYGERNKMPFAVAGLSRTLTYVLILGIGGLVLLKHFGLSVTPMLTALGVGGLAVALALQDTLANFFAGVHILVEAPIAVGDFIKLSTGEEGLVTDIGWRTTRVKAPSNSIIVIPNTKITSGILTNFSLPEPRVSAEVAILTGLDADPDQVASIAMDTAASADGVLKEFPPLVLFDPGLTPSSMQFKLIVQVASQQERGLVQSALRVKLLERFRQHNIPLPVADRVVLTREVVSS